MSDIVGARDWRQTVAAIGVVVTIASATGLAGLLIGRSQLSERVAIMEQRVIAHERMGLHSDAVSQREYQVTIRNMAEDLAEIKAALNALRSELARND